MFTPNSRILLHPYHFLPKSDLNLHSAIFCICSSILPELKIVEWFINDSQTDPLFEGLKTVRKALKDNMKSYFKDYYKDINLILAMFLDPRYKLQCFKNEPQDSHMHIRSIIEQLINSCEEYENSNENNNLNVVPEDHHDLEGLEVHECSAYSLGYKHFFSTQCDPVQASASVLSVRQALELEVNSYLNTMPLVRPRQENPLEWWRINHQSFPRLAVLAKKYLSCPPSSVESERLFSLGGNIFTSRRNRLTPEHGEKLMFLNFNLRLFDFKY